jgi:feruloyl-CoA synthase
VTTNWRAASSPACAWCSTPAPACRLSTWQRLEAVAAKVRVNEPLWMTTSWGSTETAPAITFASWKLDRPGVIGLPMPGVKLKFIPNGGKLEMRIRGDNIFPGYRNNDEATKGAFDEEGYYCIGDAGHLLDEADPLQGVVFNGRVAEDFKLTSGTWVSVGTLRVKVVSAWRRMRRTWSSPATTAARSARWCS